MSTAVLVGTSALVITPQALAQTSDDELDRVEVEEIIVTGSRIKRAGVDTFRIRNGQARLTLSGPVRTRGFSIGCSGRTMH